MYDTDDRYYLFSYPSSVSMFSWMVISYLLDPRLVFFFFLTFCIFLFHYRFILLYWTCHRQKVSCSCVDVGCDIIRCRLMSFSVY